MSAAHGFDDDEATRRLLRSRPPRAALDWAGAALAGTVTAARPLRGGRASAVHLLRVARAGGAVERAVLRRYVRLELNAEEPDIAAREARALRLVAGLEVPTPRLLALDATGAQAGVPAVLMSRLPGRVDWWPRDLDGWLGRLAGLLPPIHAACDFHPGNVLWRGGRVTGVVDWASASIGPACVDVGHCRGNLFGHGLDLAGRFTAIWEERSGASYHPWADVVTIIGFLDGLRDEPPHDRFLVEDALARAVAELTGTP